MKIKAKLESRLGRHHIAVQTNNVVQELTIPPKATGLGSSVNGGELLLLALATCFCNDIYREARKKNISIDAVQVDFEADFGADGDPGTNFSYKVKVTSDAPKEEIDDLIRHTDSVAEIHNTLRKGTAVTLTTEA